MPEKRLNLLGKACLMDEFIGEYVCPNCGVVRIADISAVTVKYPLALSDPSAMIQCEGCDGILQSKISWKDAMLFEQQGAKVDGFSFVTASQLTDGEIDSFVVVMDKEINEFLDAC